MPWPPAPPDGWRAGCGKWNPPPTCRVRPGVPPRSHCALYRAEHAAARCSRSSVDGPVADARTPPSLRLGHKELPFDLAAQQPATSQTIGTRRDEFPMIYLRTPEERNRIGLDRRGYLGWGTARG